MIFRPSNNYDLVFEKFSEVKELHIRWLTVISFFLFQDILQSRVREYDVMFVQLLFMYECYLPIAKKLKIPIIGTFSFHEYSIVDQSIGNPHPLVLPFTFYYSPKKMTFFERLKNVYCHVLLKAYYTWEVLPQVQRFYERHYPSFNLNSDAAVSLIFLNNHPTFFSRPMVPTLVEVGGIHIPPPKPLPPVINYISITYD